MRHILAGLMALTCTVALATPATTDWLNGSTEERFAKVETQLRGMDVAMMEVGYRYEELSFAGPDQNWPYAEYQIQKIQKAIRLGLARRPKRAASAQMFEAPLGAVSQAVKAQDIKAFEVAFQGLTESCNGCHQAEGVGFMRVERPAQRRSPIRGPG